MDSDHEVNTELIHEGLYDQVYTRLFERLADRLQESELGIEHSNIDPAESHLILAQYLEPVLQGALDRVTGDENQKLKKQIEICNKLLQILSEEGVIPTFPDDEVHPDAKLIKEIFKTPHPRSRTTRPDTPLSAGCLLTGTRLDPSLQSQLKKELVTADRVDILCSFIKWSGVRTLEDEFRQITSKPNSTLRIITTSYLGATDLKAIDFLQQLSNTEIKVSYDTERTRLHAKAYIFHRRSGFGCAYIGSANLTRPAITDGLEWSVKVSQYESPHLWEKIIATFETYWSDPEFVSYCLEERSILEISLRKERGTDDSLSDMPLFDLRPYSFQQEILDCLQAERAIQNRSRHLVVAATGTGKTMIAAFDYRNWCREIGENGRPRLLFVAHREEILKQSLNTFRAVLRDNNFGDLLVGSHEPSEYNHLFCSIQSWNSQGLSQFPNDYFDYVVIDEFHHAAAPSYENLIEWTNPKVLLGLTATPERADGLDILGLFGNHISAELRLPDAINRKLLSPFQYFGITDQTDLSQLTWQRGGYLPGELEEVLAVQERAQLVIQKVSEILLDPKQTRGLGFCVTKRHAVFMAEQFQSVGIPSMALTSDSCDQERREAVARLRDKHINFIFSVDLFNEGVDIPELDTVLFLRPTESLTVFLQQLGRGLRLHEEKECLTVLDFIGQAHRNFRFDVRYKALLNDPSRAVRLEIEKDFPNLPAGCSIDLERIAKEHILNNINLQIRRGKELLIDEIKALSSDLGRVPSLGEFLEHSHLEPEDIYRKVISFSRLCADAGLSGEMNEPDEDRLTKGLRRIQHVDSPSLIRDLLSLSPDCLSKLQNVTFLMMHLSLWGSNSEIQNPTDSYNRLLQNKYLLNELKELLEYRLSRIDGMHYRPELPFDLPLDLHCQYTRDEALAALGHWSWRSYPDMREGVLHLRNLQADAFFVTLNKAETDYSPTTMYQDYAISENLFHWQSQSTTSSDSPTGQRYIHHKEHGHTILLFVREHKQMNGLACPYYYLGPAEYVEHTGSRPMSIIWRLKYPMPAKLVRKTARLIN